MIQHLTGCCSIYKSMICAINCTLQLNKEKPEWTKSLKKLENTIRNKPESFDKTWESKDYFNGLVLPCSLWGN